MGKEFMGVIRSTFIIGKDGKLKHVMDKVNTKTHHDDVIKHARTAAANTGRLWNVMYDLSGMKKGEPQQLVAKDWANARPQVTVGAVNLDETLGAEGSAVTTADIVGDSAGMVMLIGTQFTSIFDAATVLEQRHQKPATGRAVQRGHNCNCDGQIARLQIEQRPDIQDTRRERHENEQRNGHRHVDL